MRISYIHGPGDAFGTFKHWKQLRADPRNIKQTYSGQFFDLIAETDAVGQIVCLSPSGASDDPRFTFETVARRSASGLAYFKEELRYARSVGRTVAKFRPDVVIVSSDFPVFALDVMPGSTDIILSLHNTLWQPYGEPSGIKQKALATLCRFAVRRARYAVCVSEEVRRQFLKLRAGLSSVTQIQMPKLPKASPKEQNSPPLRLLYVGRVEHDKGVSDVIRAFALLSNQNPLLTLKIVGDGGALNDLRALAYDLGVSEKIEFSGRVNADLVAAAYLEADLCVCPTRWSFNEGLATVPLEAASYGVPTIMSRAVPARELFGSDSIVFEPGNIDDLASKMERAVNNGSVYTAACKDAYTSLEAAVCSLGDWQAAITYCLRDIRNNTGHQLRATK